MMWEVIAEIPRLVERWPEVIYGYTDMRTWVRECGNDHHPVAGLSTQ
jgi:hypothetical protein